MKQNRYLVWILMIACYNAGVTFHACLKEPNLYLAILSGTLLGLAYALRQRIERLLEREGMLADKGLYNKRGGQ